MNVNFQLRECRYVNSKYIKSRRVFSAMLPFFTTVWLCTLSTPRNANKLFMILVSYLCRLRVNCVGVFDVLTFDNSQTNHLALMPQYQVLFIM